MKRRVIACLLVCLVAGWAARTAAIEPDGVAVYDIVLKGTSNAMTGQKFPFTANGQMTWNEATGEVTFEVVVGDAMLFNGTGTLAYGPKKSYAVTTFNTVGATGAAIFVGKFSSDKTQFKGKFQAGSPNRLGAPPEGFVFTVGAVKATQR